MTERVAFQTINRPHAYYKCFSYLQKGKFMKKMGYDYENSYGGSAKGEPNSNLLLKELKSSF